MARLSQKAWNNVIIFSMLIMFAVLNLDRFSAQDVSGPQAILADGEIVLSMQIDQNIIERVGQSWRISPNSPANAEPVSAEALATLVNNWQRAIVDDPLERVALSLFDQPRHIVVIWLAGEQQGRVYPIINYNDQVMIKINDEAKRLDFPNLSQLVAW